MPPLRQGARSEGASAPSIWGELRQDVVFTIRQLAKARAFATVAILTLAIGIGATAAVFSVLDAVVLRPLPFDHPERIVEVAPTRRQEAMGGAAPDFLALRDAHVFEEVTGAVLGAGVTMALTDVPEIVGSARVTAEYFAVFGAKPQIGRTFTAAEDAPGGPKVVVISHRLWVSHFNSDQAILGRPVQLDGLPHAVIGVMPASFDFTQASEDLWLPLALATGPGDEIRRSVSSAVRATAAGDIDRPSTECGDGGRACACRAQSGAHGSRV